MDFRPLDKTVRKIFDGDNTYMIPNFQREFSWEKKNYKDFLNDLLTSMSIEFQDSDGLIIENSDYFFGTILLVGNESNPKVEEPYIVVDGQQRLTTMTIFIAALKSLIEKVNSNYLTSFDDALLVKYKRNGSEFESARLQNKALEPVLPVNILNVQHTRDNGNFHRANSESQQWLIDSYNEFCNLLEKSKLLRLIGFTQSSKISNDDYVKLLEKIGECLLNSTVIAIYTPDQNSANIIYRNFNSRGVPLSNKDLIKNELFSILDDSTGSASALWNEADENIYNSGKKMKEYLYHYMVFKKISSTESEIYDKFMEKVEPTSKGYTEFLNDLCEKSRYYYNFIKLPDDLKLFGKKNFFSTDNNFIVKKRLEFFNDVDIKQVRVILLKLFEAIEQKTLTSSQFKEILAIITRHQILHLIANTGSNKLATHYRKYLTKFEIRDNIGEDIKEFKDDFIKLMPTKQDIISNISKLNYSRERSKKKQKKETALLKQILIELSIWEQKDTNRSNRGLEFIFNASIEHINDFSEGWDNINNLGNLLLLEQSKHFAPKNSKEKEDMYKKSDITMTKDFSKKVCSFIETPSKINDRNEELISLYYDKVKNGIK